MREDKETMNEESKHRWDEALHFLASVTTFQPFNLSFSSARTGISWREQGGSLPFIPVLALSFGV